MKKTAIRELYVKVPLPTEIVEAIEGHVEAGVRIAQLAVDLYRAASTLSLEGQRAAHAVGRDVERVKRAVKKRRPRRVRARRS